MPHAFPAVVVVVFAWAVWRHLRAAQVSEGAARVFWRVLAMQNAVCGLAFGKAVVETAASKAGPYEASSFVAVCSAFAFVLTVAAFAVLSFARTPPARRSKLFDLVILLVGSAALLYAVIDELVTQRDLVSVTMPSAVLLVVALAWMLKLPGHRPRALVLVMVGAGLLTVHTMVIALAQTFISRHPLLEFPVSMSLLVAFACWAKAAAHSSATAIADRAEDVSEEFGNARLLLFAVALLMLPGTLIVSSLLGELHIPTVVLSSSALAALVVLRFRAMFCSEQESKAELATQEKLFRSVVESVHDLILMTRYDGSIVYRSPAATRVFGDIDANALANRIDAEEAVKLARLIEKARANPAALFTGDVRINSEHEGWRCYDLSVSDLGGVIGYEAILWSLHDVTDHSRLEGELRHQALHDSLTGLPNRVVVADRIGTAASRARRVVSQMGVLFVDLDGFKHVNDSLGHAAGDELLCVVAERLKGAVREMDTVARIGGDEFAVVLESLDDQDDAMFLAERIRTVLRAPVELVGGRVSITASVGLAFGRSDNARGLLRHADVAMYEAKAAGKDLVVSFTDGMGNAGTSRLHLEMDLIDAIESGDQFVLHYQPIVGLADNQVVGAEALVRWQHPVLGLVAPMQFVPIAEEIGLIGDVGRHVLSTACHHAAAMQQESPGFTVSVNVSPRQLEGDTLIHDVQAALLDSGLPAELLILEITESSVVRNVPVATQRLHQIRALGARIAIDDFGTGFSSVSALRDLPVDILKIDRSFVAGMHESPEGSTFVHALIEMCRSLNLWTVAEGVEHEGERDDLIAENCDAAQGYLFGRPEAHPTQTDRVPDLVREDAGRIADEEYDEQVLPPSG